MSIVVLNLPAVKRKNEGRPKQCPICSGATFQRWGQVNKQVKDTRIRQVKVYRYRCCHCKHTFRHYPAGVRRAQQSERLMKLCLVMGSLGLSHRSVVLILGGVWGEFEPYEWLAGCAGGRATDPPQAEVESGTDRGGGWSLGQW